MAASFQQTPQRILVRGVNWLGDAVMTTPALLRLREKFSDAHIALVTPEKLKDLYLHHPAVNQTIPFSESQGLLEIAFIIRNFEGNSVPRREATGRRVKANFDLAIVFPNSPRAALETYFARIPRRVGYARPWRNWFLTEVVPTRPGHVKMRKRTPMEIQELVQGDGAKGEVRNPIPETAHQLHEYLYLISAVGASPAILPPQLCVRDDEVQAAAERFQIDPKTSWLGINAGAEYGPAKRWPAESFQFLVREAAAWPGWGVLLFGGKADVPANERIEQEFWAAAKKWATPPKLVNLAGRTTLRELMALLKSCRGLITNDTGPMHVAAALGISVVVPFGSTSPALTGPGLPGDLRHRLLESAVPCSPCFLRECPIDFRCMKAITVERVTAAAVDVFRH